ncbi:Vsp/OspC family lipoprotein [Borrelia puertoricensis]|uniref:Vsp/OspC family lipoprotein n=1 Tax=Borrelia puertoricensis TaxID=2756107 RepID=UPI001FF62DC8|nr:Vsp/OspC family lipoprotein [Borrelia puertoricensis]
MKRITLCALFLTLFLLSSCNTSGAATKDGQAAKSDGTLIDLVTITKNIKDSVAFAKSVKEIHTLVKSIDELAKAIGKKIKNDGTLEAVADKNGSLIAGVVSIAAAIEAKVGELKIADSLKGLNGKVKDVEDKTKAFTAKLKNQHAVLGAADGATTDENAKKAIDYVNKANGDNGAKELGEINTAIDALLNDAEAAVTSAINVLTTSTKSASPAQSN